MSPFNEADSACKNRRNSVLSEGLPAWALLTCLTWLIFIISYEILFKKKLCFFKNHLSVI